MAFDVVRAKDFVSQLEKSIGLLSALSKFQKVFERNASPISDVFKVFLELPATFNEIKMPISAFGIISSVLKERFDFVYGDAHSVSYLLDPRYAGKDMDPETRDGVEEFIAKWNGPDNEDTTMIELMKFQAATTRQIILVRDQHIGVQEFWHGVSGFPLLRKIATTVFASACSSAAAERNFS
ncbi:hypothetical protein PF005_g339 [Phytophthora fragariae]|uniref:HAT C-terminal dimerisation domain-containing protein n=1 Tax=Phytophthora fragariae TaxID=53985 RepID=A0A6A3FT59_9STRA|nr:hypothetical protein PF003_g12506 [Phytophthora fragariae]KAE8948739.1 hypothetical protein PF009_g1697 [Phytophthora fragariae]KAE9137790.1 hypothetical protein PF007_g1677 [Phytophthora fragariae]KAE9238178.1 hypothetical protein PF005_g339 [Phytophthora fragariae]KAE9257876.1 hypothetical protein PF002_g620 [Phytophthora fragariae]